MDKVRIGIIGLGNIGTTHAKNITEGKCSELVLTAIADVSAERREWAMENYPETEIFSDADGMMKSGKIDAVIVAIPHYFHTEYAIKAMGYGLHVMVEKPAGVYTKQVREMNEAAQGSDVVFGMMFNQRTNHIYRKAREIVQSGEMGQIRRVNWIITNWYRSQAYFDSGDWRATWSGEGGGVLMNQAPHNLDLWQWICGMPKKIYAKMEFGKWHDIEVEDDVTIFAEYENGATGVFITSTGDAPGRNRLEITLDRGCILVENGKIRVSKLEMTEQEFSAVNTEPFGTPKRENYNPETDGKNEQHVGVLNSFASSILHGTPLIANGEEGINALSISNAAHLSAWLGREITLPLDEELFYSELMKRVATSRRKSNVITKVSDLEGTYGTDK